MTTYIVFTREKTIDPAELKTYGEMAGAASAGHNLTPLVIYGKQEVLEGPEIEGVVVLAFANAQEAKAWYNSDAYKAAREHRFKGAQYRAVMVEGI
ncbi:MAG TPA: DUF1330 domain-containing protein [Alphaproteobacteria bacterium]|nr:DUF1330 domain-containing protein [Alphaproteobacteria bacterium]